MAIKGSYRKLLLSTLAVAQVALACSLSLNAAANAQEAKTARPHIDLAFCIDTTGSMQHEIDNVKAKTKEIVAKLAGGKPSPVIRVGLVAYRDRGDEYVTKVFPFTEDIDKIVKDISALEANGGGDTPEAVNQALHASVNDLKWTADSKTLKMLFLIGDAGPSKYPGDFDWRTESKAAIAKGIQINSVGCQGLESMPEPDGVGVFKEIAHLADGKYEPLSYRHEVAQADGTRATVVSSGGALYKMESKSADWREGASALASKGKAARLDVPAARAMAVDAMMAGAPAGGGGAGMLTRTKAGRSAGFFAAPAAMPMSAAAESSLSSRDENNLADLVLNATKDAAKRRLNVDFKDK